MALAAVVLLLLDVSGLPQDVRTHDAKLGRAIMRARRAWHRRAFTKETAPGMVRRAFENLEFDFIHYAPEFKIGDWLENDCGEEFQKFKGLGRFGGRQNQLTERVLAMLRKNRGVVFLTLDAGPPDHLSELPTRHVLFTLDWGNACSRNGFVYVRLK
jgi:hypothetical protein